MRPVVLFDGRCGFCTWSVNFAQHTVRANVDFVPYQSVDVADYGLTTEQCAEAVQYVHDGYSRAGEAAVASILQSGRGAWKPLGRLMAAQPVRPLAAVVYRFIARHRGRLWGVRPPIS